MEQNCYGKWLIIYNKIILDRFTDFAVERQFNCHATEAGFAGDIGTIEIWLIDW